MEEIVSDLTSFDTNENASIFKRFMTNVTSIDANTSMREKSKKYACSCEHLENLRSCVDKQHKNADQHATVKQA